MPVPVQRRAQAYHTQSSETSAEDHSTQHPIKRALISFVSYDQDSFEVKSRDKAFMRSFFPDEKGRLPKDRMEIWRPSIALAQLQGLNAEYPDLVFDKYYLFHNPTAEDRYPPYRQVVDEVLEDITTVKPASTELIDMPISFYNAFDYKEVLGKLKKLFSDDNLFPRDNVEYYINYTSGTTQIRNCLFLLTHQGFFNGQLIAPSPWENHLQREKTVNGRPGRRWSKGCYALDDLRAKEESGEIRSDFQKLVKDMSVGPRSRNDFQEIFQIVNNIRGIDKTSPHRWKHPILITGETGVGKTILARNIASLMGLSQKFVSFNCALLKGSDEKLQIIELFGSGTDRYNAKKSMGLLEQAKDGLLFLDEVGELSLSVQGMLLKAIEENQFRRFGENKYTKSGFQLICGTNRDLDAAVLKGNFRQDLLARINLWHFALKPIRERKEDFDISCDKMIQRFRDEYKRTITVEEDAKACFLAYAKDDTTLWPNNWREFNAMLTRIFLRATDGTVRVGLVQKEIDRARKQAQKIEELRQQLGIDTVPTFVTAIPTAQPSSETLTQTVKESPARARIGAEFYDKLNARDKATADRLISAYDEVSATGRCTLEQLAERLTDLNGKRVNKATISRWLNECCHMRLTRGGDLVPCTAT